MTAQALESSNEGPARSKKSVVSHWYNKSSFGRFVKLWKKSVKAVDARFDRSSISIFIMMRDTVPKLKSIPLLVCLVIVNSST